MAQSLRGPIGADSTDRPPPFSYGGAAVAEDPFQRGGCIVAQSPRSWRSTRSWRGTWPRWQSWSCGIGCSPAVFVAAGALALGRGLGVLIRLLIACPYSVNGGHAVREDRVSMAALLSSVEGAGGLVYSEDLRLKDLLVCVQIKALAGPPIWALPHARCSYSPTVQA